MERKFLNAEDAVGARRIKRKERREYAKVSRKDAKSQRKKGGSKIYVESLQFVNVF